MVHLSITAAVQALVMREVKASAKFAAMAQFSEKRVVQWHIWQILWVVRISPSVLKAWGMYPPW